jgi:predicted Zn-dependent protease
MPSAWMERVLALARSAGCADAEIFVKEGRGRNATLEPAARASGESLLSISRAEEAGAALRLVDRDERWGFAWTGLGHPVDPGRLVEAALLAAGHGPRRETGSAIPIPMADGPPRGEASAPVDRGAPDLGLVDPDCMERGETELAGLLRAGVAEVEQVGEGLVEVDRIVIAEAATTIRIASTRGLAERFDRTMAFLTVSLVPAAPDAGATVEERAVRGLGDLDPRECAREAVWRALPERTSVPDSIPAAARQAVCLVLSPRAGATLIGALAPWALSGGVPGGRKASALHLADDPLAPGRPGSAPFDGVGRPTERTPLVEAGRSVGRIGARSGHVQRPSYRELPAVGPAGIVVACGQRAGGLRTGGERPGTDVPGSETRDRDSAGVEGPVVLRAAVIEVSGGRAWSIRVRRGDWWRGGSGWEGGERLGPADGLTWEGPIQALVQAITQTGRDPRWFQCGPAIACPSLWLDGLSPWRLPSL